MTPVSLEGAGPWDVVREIMPAVSALLMGLVALLLKKLNTGQTTAAVAATKAADAAQHAAAVVIADGAERSEQLTGLTAQGGKIHALVDGSLTAYKQLVAALAESDAALRRQLEMHGIQPEHAQVPADPAPPVPPPAAPPP